MRDRVGQELLDVLDDRRVLDVRVVLDRRDCGRAVLEADLHVLEVGHVLERGAARLDEPAIAWPELVVLDDDRLGHEVGLEAHLLQRLQVGRIGDRDVQLVAALVERQHAARLRDLEVDQLLVDLVGVERVRSSSGVPNARDANTASCCAVMRLPSSTCSTKEMLAAWACVCSASASYSDMRPFCASARASPLMLRVAACVAMGVGWVRLLMGSAS